MQMRTTIRLIAFFCCFAGILVLAETKTDYNHHADFTKYHSFSWIKAQTENPLWTDRITTAINSELTGKGWSQAPSGGDVSIAAYGGTRTEQSLETWYSGFGGGWRWRGFGDGIATTTVENIPVGTLQIDIFDSSTKELIWRGSATDTLSDKPEKNEKKLEKSIGDMFKKFPPESKG